MDEGVEKHEYGRIGKRKQLKSVVSYQVFALEQKSKLNQKYPFLKAHQINLKLKSMWSNLSPNGKSMYRKFTLISTPTPPKRESKQNSKKTPSDFKGRLMTPKVLISGRNQTPTKNGGMNSNTSKTKSPVQRNVSQILDPWDKAVLGPYPASDDDVSDNEDVLDSQDDVAGTSNGSPLPWGSVFKTYDNTKYPLEKNYPVPEIVGASCLTSNTTPGILKRKGQEITRPPTRVSFSTEDAEVKIMSEREDSCSTVSPSQEVVPRSPPVTFGDENPYDFDAIDKFEICVGTPDKSAKFTETTPNAKCLPSEKRTKPPRKGLEKKKMVPAPCRHLLRSRSTSATKSEKPGRYVYKFDEPSSPVQDMSAGGGDAENSLQETKETVDLPETRKTVIKQNSQLLSAAGDNQAPLLPQGIAANGGSKRTPVPATKTDCNPKVNAPRKKKQKTVSLSQSTPKLISRAKEQLITCETFERRRSPRLNKEVNKDYLVSCTNHNRKRPSALLENKSSISKDNKCPNSVQNSKQLKTSKTLKDHASNYLDQNANNFDIETDAEENFLNSSERFSLGKTETLIPSKPASLDYLVDENSNSSETGFMSPVLLAAKSRLSVAETLRGLKMITSPDNPEFSDSSTECARLLSPTLSDISLLSSVSSSTGGENIQQPKILEQAPVEIANKTNIKNETLSKMTVPKHKSSRQPLAERPLQRPVVQRQTNEPLCDLFENMTPPQRKYLSSRRLLASSGDEGVSNFSRLFDEGEIFG